MFGSQRRAFEFVVARCVSGIVLGFALLSGPGAQAAFQAKLQAQSFGSTNWSTASATGYAGGDFVPTRVHFTGGPASNQTIDVDFDHTKTSGQSVFFGIQDLVQFTTSSNVVITSGPTLSAPVGVDKWHYIFVVTATDAN